MRRVVFGVLVAFAPLVAACGSTSGTAATTTTSGASVTTITGATTTTPQATANPLLAWCALTLGESKASVLAAMGPPHGTASADLAKAMGVTNVDTGTEWDVAGDILLAEFKNDVAYQLHAYAGHIGMNPATNIGCEAFRS